MNIENMISTLEKTDFSKWKAVQNRTTHTVWLSEMEDGLKINVRLSGSNYSVRFYEFNRANTNFSESQRLDVRPERMEHNVLKQFLHDGEVEEKTNFIIVDINEICEEEAFFQRSLVENFGSLTHTTFIRIQKLTEEVINVGKGYLVE